MSFNDALAETQATIGTACGTCQALDALDPETRAEAETALAGMRRGEGANFARALTKVSGRKVDATSPRRHVEKRHGMDGGR